MREKELQELREGVQTRLASYAGCSEEGAVKIMRLIKPVFSAEGGMLYHLSDLLSSRGY